MFSPLHKYSTEIIDTYINNFPIYLRQSNQKFKKQIHNYPYFDIWINNEHINNFNLLQKNELTNDFFGFAFFNYFPKYNLIHLDYVSLNKNYQGNGNGSKYLQYLINTFYKSNSKINFFILECENKLIKFYEKNGFIKIKFNYFYKGIKLNLMLYNNYITKYKCSLLYKLANVLVSYFLNTIHILSIIILYMKYIINYMHIFIIYYKYHILDNFK
jgi:hypothetical protein